MTTREFSSNFEYVLKYLVFPLAVVSLTAPVAFAVIRSKERRKIITGEQYIYIIFLTKIYIIDDPREYMTYSSGIL